MSDAIRCSKCGYVYWVSARENFGTCSKCGFCNDIWITGENDMPLLVDSSVIFQTIPYDVDKWAHLNPGVKKKENKFNRYTALTKDQE